MIVWSLNLPARAYWGVESRAVGHCLAVTFSGTPTSHIKKRHQRKFEYPLSWVTKWAPKTPFDLFLVGCPQSRDAFKWGYTRHVNQFHHAISQCWLNFGPLISGCFSRSRNLGSRTNLCWVSQLSLEFDYPLLSFKEYSTLLYSIAREMCRNAQAKVLSLITSNPPRDW